MTHQQLSNIKNEDIIHKYFDALETEINPSKSYQLMIHRALIKLSQFNKGKPFAKMKRDDIIAYLNSLRKSEDPMHRWIGTYNLQLICITKFFKWLFNPALVATADATALSGIDKAKKIIDKHKKSPQNIRDITKKFGDACLSCW